MRTLWISIGLVVITTACASNTRKSAPSTPAAIDKAATQSKVKAKTSTPTAGTVTCKNGADQRVLEVKDQDGGCETLYTKAGEAKSVATSNSGRKHCEDVAAKIQKHLADAGFSCQ